MDLPTVIMPPPEKIIIPMLQHIGVSCMPSVKKGDRVWAGQKIGDSEAFVTAPVHSSVSGIVSDIKPVLYPDGSEAIAVEIKPDQRQVIFEKISPLKDLDRESLLLQIRESGLVGLGGAGFPTAVKLSPPPGKMLDTLIINGAECEPYITSDYREMVENPADILEGIKIVMDLTGIQRAFIGIESNKPEAVKRMSFQAEKYPGIQIVSLPSRYPQGGEKQIIYAVTGRKVPTGGLPSDIGVLVHNVNTVSFLAGYVKTGMPLIKKKVTVDGGAVKRPMNLEVLIGTPLKEVFEFCGGFTEEPRKIIMGGPMMGVAQYSLENPILKHTNALLAFTAKEAALPLESVCLRCGKCVSVCPMGLLPLFINAHIVHDNIEEALKYHLNDCIECGCCSYSCPASRHLVQSIRYAKAKIKEKSRKDFKEDGK
ncbi:MAG: electron transport complex subunit RsxC [Firmicutes bacterium]|nr:electron transport complex subunit RsxC [Bacillota bacterium]